jgi:hypothetical protein
MKTSRIVINLSAYDLRPKTDLLFQFIVFSCQRPFVPNVHYRAPNPLVVTTNDHAKRKQNSRDVFIRSRDISYGRLSSLCVVVV